MAAGLLSDELHAPLERYVLPLLSARALVNLSLTCRSVRAGLLALDPSIWRHACRRDLPASHPGPASDATAQDVLQLLQLEHRRSIAKHNLLAGTPVTIHHFENSFQPVFSPDGKEVAMLTRAHQLLLRVHETSSGALLRERSVPEPCNAEAPELSLAWHTDGLWLTLLTTGRHCWTVDAGLQASHVFEVDFLDMHTDITPTLSPGGRYVLSCKKRPKYQWGDGVFLGYGYVRLRFICTLTGQMSSPDLPTIHRTCPYCIAWDHADQQLAYPAVEDTDWRIVYLNMHNHIEVRGSKYCPALREERGIEDLVWASRGCTIVALVARYLYIWAVDGDSYNVVSLYRGPGGLTVSADGSFVAIRYFWHGTRRAHGWMEVLGLHGQPEPHCIANSIIPSRQVRAVRQGKWVWPSENWPSYECISFGLCSGNMSVWQCTQQDDESPADLQYVGSIETELGREAQTCKPICSCTFLNKWSNTGMALHISGMRYERYHAIPDTGVDVLVFAN